MSYWILPVSGVVISCTTVQRLTHSEMQTDEWKNRMQQFDRDIETKLETASTTHICTPDHDSAQVLDLEDEDPEFLEEFNRVISDESIRDTDETDSCNWQDDPYLSMEIGLP